MKYTPRYKIESAVVIFNNKKIKIAGRDIANGTYKLESGGFLKDYTYIPKRDIVSINESSATSKIISGLHVKTSALGESKDSNDLGYNVKAMNQLLPPNKVFDKPSYPDYPEMFRLANKVVTMRKQKAKVSEYSQYSGELFTHFYEELKVASEAQLKYLAYLFFWYNSHVPTSQRLNGVFDGISPNLNYNSTFQKIFDQLPFKPYSVKQVQRGNFLKNTKEQKIVSTFAGVDDLRPMMMMTSIDDGYAVSTNAHVLIALYDKTLKRKKKLECYQKKCEGYKFEKDARFPDWRNILLKGDIRIFEVDTKDLLDQLMKIKTYSFYLDSTRQMIINFDRLVISFNTELLTIAIRSMYELGYKKVYLNVQAPNRGMQINAIPNWGLDRPDSTFTMTMPVFMGEKFTFLHDAIDLTKVKEIKNSNAIFAEGGQTESREFKNWFQNSQITKNNKPLVVYHGTSADFGAFKGKHAGKHTSNSGKLGFFFTDNPDLASDFSKKSWSKDNSNYRKGASVIPVYLKLENPKTITARQFTMINDPEDFTFKAKADGFDGIIIEPFSNEDIEAWERIWGNDGSSKEFKSHQYVAFYPTQIKSAIGNKGSFISHKGDITLAKGGQIDAPNLLKSKAHKTK